MMDIKALGHHDGHRDRHRDGYRDRHRDADQRCDLPRCYDDLIITQPTMPRPAYYRFLS